MQRARRRPQSTPIAANRRRRRLLTTFETFAASNRMQPPTCARALSLKQKLPQRRNLSAVTATGAVESARLRSCCSSQQFAAFAVKQVAARQHLYLLAAVTSQPHSKRCSDFATHNAAAIFLHSPRDHAWVPCKWRTRHRKTVARPAE